MPWTITVASFVIASYIRLVYKTSRWVFEGEDFPRAHWNKNHPLIICFWHGRLLMLSAFWKKASTYPFHMLASPHSNGDLSSQIMEHFGILVIRGSSQKKGVSAFRALVKILRQSHSVGITPDGQKPGYRVGDGTVRLAQLSGCDILPVAFSTSRYRILSSWDRFFLALPFSRGAFVCGAPISPLEETDTEKFRQKIEEGLKAVTRRADHLCGLSHP